MDNGFGKIKKVAKRVGDKASEFETKTDPLLDRLLNRITNSHYSGRIILGIVLVAVALGWWAAL